MSEKIEERAHVTAYLVRELKRKQPENAAQKFSDFKSFIYRSRDLDNIPPFVQRYDGQAEFKVCGVGLPEVESVPIKLYGKWKLDPKWGPQFSAEAFEIQNPTTKSGIVKLFTGSLFPGIGAKTAKKISEVYGLDTFRIIEENPRQLLNVVPAQKIGTILTNYKKIQSYGRLVAFLAPFGISTSQCIKIHERYGDNAEQMIRNNPYCLEEISGIGFQKCDRIAIGLSVALDSDKRIEGCISEAIKTLCMAGDSNAGGGHMYVKLFSLYNRTMQMLNAGNSFKVKNERFDAVLKQMVADQKIVCRFKDNMYPAEYEKAEYQVAQKLVKLMKNPVNEVMAKRCTEYLDTYCKENNVNLHESQAEAVLRSLSNRVSIITGGPGTGKTTIISAILACYEAVYGDNILLMAPTGKAARRMSESTHRPASTIHSRLHIYGEPGADIDLNPIDGGLVVVDECSMVDNLLMENLMDAITNPDTQIIFVGDIDQLPSVGVGAVLGEMINSGVIPTSRLTKTFRQRNGGGTIIEDAKKINTGEYDLEYDDSFQFIEASGDQEASEIIMRLYRKEVAEFGIENVALLCPLRSSRNGKIITCSEMMNQRIQSAINPDAPEKASARIKNRIFRVNDRVMQWQNTAESANGDIGEITNIAMTDDGVQITVMWESGIESKLNQTDMDSISLAYAMSIHKSQGSEYQSVIIPILSDQMCPLFKRNLLYTGVTRAKKRVILVGDKRAIDETISKTDTNIRMTHLAKRLQHNA